MDTTSTAERPPAMKRDMESDKERDQQSGRQRSWIRIALFLIALVALYGAFHLLPVQSYLTDFLSWTERLGWLGALALVVTYVVTTVALVPGSILTLGAGYTYGVGWGFAIISAASTLAAAVAFLLGRFVARDTVKQKLQAYPKFRAVDRALEDESFKVVFLLRLVPVMPYNFLNYALSVSGVTFWRYVVASWLGMMPGTLMYIYFGSLAEKATRLAAGADAAGGAGDAVNTVPVWDVPTTLQRLMVGDLGGGVGQNLIYWVGLVATVAVATVITRRARAELERITSDTHPGDTHPGDIHPADTHPEESKPLAFQHDEDGVPQIEPQDDYNRELIGHVHPPDWQNPEVDGAYNLVAIGGGTAGLVGAAGAASLGAKSALIEADLLGGDCLNWGCVPSKALIRSARAAHQARTAAEFGVEIDGEVTVDFPKVMERMRRLRTEISHHDSAERFDDLGADVFMGRARFVDEQTIEVGGQRLRFKKALIATGAKPFVPPIDGLEEAGYLTNETVFQLTELPERMAVIGGGPIGCELAQCFQRFGSEVTLLEMTDGILPREDREAAAIVAESLRRDGVDIRTATRASAVRTVPGTGEEAVRGTDERVPGTEKIVELSADLAPGDAAGSDEITVDAILVAAGRSPNVEGLNLEAAGVDYDPKKGVLVNDRLQTSNSRVYAAGDVASEWQFTHTADAQARIVLQNALFFGRAKNSNLTVPWATYTDPEIAHVGLYEQQARERGFEVDTLTQPLADVDRALLEGNDEGFLKLVLKAGSDEILGATLVGEGAGDLISELTLTMQGDLGLGTLANTIHPYPTTAEVAKKSADAYNRGRLKPWMKSILETWFRWLR